jgi:lipid-A-disaccharide synthase
LKTESFPESNRASGPSRKSPDYKIVIVAGEASGDLHGSNLIKALRLIEPGFTVQGIGGKRLKKAGVDLIADVSRMGVVGITEVLFRIPLIIKKFLQLKKLFRENTPDLLILIDYSGFNLPLARAAKKQGIKILYYISPQVWASRKGRIKKIRETVDQMAVIIPFEAPLYKKEGVNATFVGHPLVGNVRPHYPRAEALRHFNLEEGRPIVGILPGSRPGEVKRLLPVMLETGIILKRSFPALQFVLPLASTLNPSDISDMLKGIPLDVRIVREETYDAVAVSDVVMVASGTATLETALLETPMIIVYKVSELTYQIGKRFVYIDQIGLVNIIAGKPIVPEFVQGAARPKDMARAVAELLEDQKAREVMIAELKKVRLVLGDPGASERAARIAAEMLHTAKSRKPVYNSHV